MRVCRKTESRESNWKSDEADVAGSRTMHARGTCRMEAEIRMRLTKLFEHFVALVQDEVLDFGGVEDLVSDEGVESTGGGDHDMGALGLVAEEVGVLDHRGTAEESADTDVGHVLGETSVLVLDLESKLTGVAQNNDRHLAVDRLELLQSRENEHRSLSVTRLRLTKHVHSKNSLGNTLLLHCSL